MEAEKVRARLDRRLGGDRVADAADLDLDHECPGPEDRSIFAASAAEAKEPTSTRGSASCWGPRLVVAGLLTERAQEATPAWAPPGVPAKSKISWGGLAPGRLGRRRCEVLPGLDTRLRLARSGTRPGRRPA